MAGGRAGNLRRDMAASLRSYWDSAAGYQRFLYALAALFFVSGVVHSAVFLVDGGAWEGPVSWRKPISFAFSFSLVSASFAWVGTWLPRRPVAGWLVFGSFGVASVGETFLITMQRWRGTASHFNSSSSFDELVFAAMGGLIAIIVVDIVVEPWAASRRSPDGRRPTSRYWRPCCSGPAWRCCSEPLWARG